MRERERPHLPPTMTPKKQAMARPPSISPLAIKIEPYQKAKAHVEYVTKYITPMPAPLAKPILTPTGTEFLSSSEYFIAIWLAATKEKTVLIELTACSAMLPTILKK